MGMYTGLRFEAKLKPFVADAIDLILSEENQYSMWDALAGVIPIDRKWLNVGRKDFIPFGSMSYMPDDWYHRNDIYRHDQRWFVCCSLKNYEGEKLAIFNEAGFLEIAVFRSNPSKIGSANSLLGLSYRDVVLIQFIN